MRPIPKLAALAAGAVVAAALAAAAPAHADDGHRGGHHGGGPGYHQDNGNHYGHRPGYGPRHPWVQGWPGYRARYVRPHHRHRPPVYRYAPGGLVIVIRP